VYGLLAQGPRPNFAKVSKDYEDQIAPPNFLNRLAGDAVRRYVRWEVPDGEQRGALKPLQREAALRRIAGGCPTSAAGGIRALVYPGSSELVRRREGREVGRQNLTKPLHKSPGKPLGTESRVKKKTWAVNAAQARVMTPRRLDRNLNEQDRRSNCQDQQSIRK
jgi:hypothetical protein